ncbi:MAG: phenylacetic acid degradation operon negative regulatory protein PaaX [Gammaproteobacteria bacterium]|nr:phenylacetic acid degradation operon negative regulatory protein PaaX [Gammaproteobacteria bacterium]
MSRLALIDHLVAEFAAQPRIRAGSLIITVFGDAVAPRGGTLWLGSLIRLLEPFGLNQRLVRTSVFRLVRDGWLSAEQSGRRSYYSLTETGRRRFENAYRRIYTGPHEAWDGYWHVIATVLVDPSQRDAVRKELKWLGFGAIGTGVMAHPMPDCTVLRELLADLGVSDDLVQWRAGTDALPGGRAQRRLIEHAWDLGELTVDYQRFLDRFRPVYAALEREREVDPGQAFLVRTLLMHEYRRILLRDPKLPLDLLPAHWAGSSAYALCRNVYQRIHGLTEAYLGATLETADGPLPATAEYFYRRFGGLD